MKSILRASLFTLVAFLSITSLKAQTSPQTPSASTSEAADLVKQARQLNSEGKQSEAVALYKKAISIASGKDLYDALLGAGSALDLKGQYDDARKYLAKAIEVAPPDSKVQALKAMAFSYAFERKPREAAKYEQDAFNRQTDEKKIGRAHV